MHGRDANAVSGKVVEAQLDRRVYMTGRRERQKIMIPEREDGEDALGSGVVFLLDVERRGEKKSRWKKEAESQRMKERDRKKK